MQADWQTLVAMLIGAAALGYVLRRWWPGQQAPIEGSNQNACGPSTAPQCKAGCGSCGQPDQAAHRIHILQKKTREGLTPEERL
jgi:hypothetical protein